jgi:PAS domain S-box-containing protein
MLQRLHAPSLVNKIQPRFAPISRIFALLAIGVPIILYFIAAFMNSGLHLSSFSYNPYALISLISLVIDLALLGVMLSKPTHSEETVWLIIYMLLYAVVAASEALSNLSVSAPAAVFWMRAGAPVALLPPVLVLFALTYTNRTARRFNALAAFLVVSGLFFLMYSLLVYPFSADLLKYAVRAPWGWDINNSYNSPPILGPIPLLWYIGATLVAVARLLSFRRHTKNNILRRQSLIFVLGVAMPIMAAVAIGSISIIFPKVVIPPLTTPTSVLAAAILVYGMYRYHVLTVSPTQFSETILSLMQESVIVIDKQYVILYINPTAEKLLNMSAIHKDRMNVEQVLTPESATLLRQAKDSTKTGLFSIDRLDIIRQSSASIPVKISSSRLQLTDYEAWVMVLTDISADVHTRSVIEHEVTVRTHEVRQARASLVASISSLQQGFLLVNTKGIIELSNQRAEDLFSITKQGITGKSVSQVAAQYWKIDFEEVVRHVLSSQRSKKLQIASQDGSFYNIYITPVLLHDHPLGATIVIEDVTEAKILDRSKDEFFSIASHELRTPLTAIRGNMSMVKDYFPDAMKDQGLNDLVSDTHTASVRLIEIVNDFLDSSKLEQGKMMFTITPVTVESLVAAVQGDLAALISDQHNTVVIAGLSKLPQVMADESRLHQILFNVLSNANKYCENGTITIAGEVQDGKVLIKIIDTGKGMSNENQKLLFHKFQQAGADILTRDNTKGTGLGLYISRLLATNMHGNVVLERSEEGKGSCFVISLQSAHEQ